MGLFSKLKKAFKKIGKAVKKVVKKVVGGVKKVVKKISSSKILKALAIAAAVIVTGGAALTAFGGTMGTGALGNFGTWMMSTSQNVLGGTLFSGSGTLAKVGNFATKTIAKPFGAVGGALGSTARVGANLLGGQSAFAPGTAVGAPTPFSGAALSGQLDYSQVVYDPVNQGYLNNNTGLPLTQEQVNQLPKSFTSIINKAGGGLDSDGNIIDVSTTPAAQSGFFDSPAGNVLQTVGTNVLTGAAMQYIQGDPELQGSMSGAAYEGAEYMDPLKVYAAQQGINTDDIYSHMMYGNVDPSTQYGNDLYRQQTFGVA